MFSNYLIFILVTHKASKLGREWLPRPGPHTKVAAPLSRHVRDQMQRSARESFALYTFFSPTFGRSFLIVVGDNVSVRQ